MCNRSYLILYKKYGETFCLSAKYHMCQKLYYTARHLTSVMDQKLMYAFRGWIGFVAFMDMGTAIRCFIEKRSFFGPQAYSNAIELQFNKIGNFIKDNFFFNKTEKILS